MKNIKIQTSGMHCSSCEILLKDSLEEIGGVNRAEASHETGIVDVNFDGTKTNEQAIIDIIKLEGYEIK